MSFAGFGGFGGGSFGGGDFFAPPQLPPGVFPPTASSGASADSSGGDTASTVSDYLDLALQGFQAYTQYDLAKSLENSQRASTYKIDANGNPVLSLGASPLSSLTGSGSSSLFIWIIIIVVVLLLLRK